MRYCDSENKLRHYVVVSGVLFDGNGWSEPREPYHLASLVLAHNRGDAKVKALKGEVVEDGQAWATDWSDWRAETAGSPPYKGLKVEDTLCDHGTCWACCPQDGPECCIAEDRAQEHADAMALLR